MYSLALAAVLIVSVSVDITKCSGCDVVSSHCPPWTILNTTSNDCQCGRSVAGIVRCNSETCDISVKSCYCLTYSEALNESLLSYCLYTCNYRLQHNFWEYYQLDTDNVLELNDVTCGRFNRTGLMCGECIADHAPAVYSYDLACVECQDYKYNWLKYIAVAYVPLTVFYILIVSLRFSVSSASMVVYVTVSQIIAAPGLMRFYYSGLTSRYLTLEVLLNLYAIWNLDFFRGVYKPFCLHPDLSMLQVICLDYIVGVYPLVLIFITYCFVRLHDRYVVISKLWKPFFKLFSFLRREWNIRESLVNAFAAFIVLSYVKMMNVSFDLITPSHSYRDLNGSRLRSPHDHLFMNGSLPYFGKEHIPYAICAILMLLVFNIIPLLLLCLYPSVCFQKCLNLTKCSCPGLHIFMDTLLGCYKVKPLDCRYFAGFYIFLRCVNLVSFSFAKDIQYYLYSVYALVLTVILVAAFKPYKNAKRNYLDIAFFSLSILLYTALGHLTEDSYVIPDSARHKGKGNIIIMGIFLSFFPIYGICVGTYQIARMATKMPCFSFLSQNNRQLESSFSNHNIDNRNEGSPLLMQI